MIRKVLCACFLITGCSVSSSSHFFEVKDSISPTIVVGYASLTQETLGIYPRAELSLAKGESCLYVDRKFLVDNGVKQWDKLEVSGTIRKTGCDEQGVVCLENCQKYQIAQPKFISVLSE